MAQVKGNPLPISKVEPQVEVSKSASQVRILVLIFLGFSLVWHLSMRNDHFQELDSDWPYLAIHGFPNMAYSYMGWSSYKSLPPMGEAKATSLMKNRSNVKDLRRGGALQGLDDASMKVELAKMPIAKAKRLMAVNRASAGKKSFAIQALYALPYTTTYSPGPGLIYGLLSSPKQGYGDFMASALFLTLVLAHLAVWLIYLTGKRMGYGSGASAVGALLALFSISMYSYGYHAGSTIWNTISAALWLYLLSRWWTDKRGILYLGLVAFVLAFFNYLFIVYLASSVAAWIVIRHPFGEPALEWVKGVFKRSILLPVLGGLGILIIALQFLQPGQGNRASFGELSDLPLATLNVSALQFSLFDPNGISGNIQGILGLALLTMGVIAMSKNLIRFAGEVGSTKLFAIFSVIALILCVVLGGLEIFKPMAAFFAFCNIILRLRIAVRRDKTVPNSPQALVELTCIGALAVYLVIVYNGALGFAPTRHVLFLAPIAYLIVIAGVSLIGKKFQDVSYQQYTLPLLGALGLVGLLGVYLRSQTTQDAFSGIEVAKHGTKEIILVDKMTWRGEEDLPPGIKVSQSGPEQGFAPGQTYLYMSQTVPWYKTRERWKGMGPIQFDMIDSQSITPPVYFSSFNPKPERYNFTRPNHVYAAWFKVSQLKP